MSEEQNPYIRPELERARRALSSARTLLPDDPGGAANRTYYAAFHAAKAALLSVGETARSHAGTRGRFGLHFVRTGRVTVEVSRALIEAESLRLFADYDEGEDLTAAEVRPVIALVERFIEAVEAALSDDAGG